RHNGPPQLRLRLGLQPGRPVSGLGGCTREWAPTGGGRTMAGRGSDRSPQSLHRGPPTIDASDMDTSSRHHWCNRLRLSLRRLIALVLFIGCCMGWMVRSARVQRDAVAALEGTYSPSADFYDWQRVEKTGYISSYKLDAAPPWPRWFVD